MLILGIDTSAVAAGAAVIKDGKVISETYLNTGLTHSQTIMCLIDTALKNADIDFSKIDAVAVAAGPGSFTGIRIGVSAVKGLCFASDKPCFPVSTLEALANCADIDGFIICPVMDARCMQVYCALFEKNGDELLRISEDAPKTLEELSGELKAIGKKVLLIGDGSDIAYKFFAEKGLDVRKFPEIYKYQHASGVAIAAYRNYNKGVGFISADMLKPDYLRLSQAERELKKSGDDKNDSIKQ
ncbi:MAG: tRNA (adenosine(37)-N6)-threonylcarbamoyltransferase complex dimerization subunit type 1 TsaB [Clostridia bacterium]|nr:tRNA (adenosine(37)-N6)-threonylcarbamoyltransferase complex dimerization subunit type 1 TsaB [Clostridia bacterium]